jgi:hypothetical protein
MRKQVSDRRSTAPGRRRRSTGRGKLTAAFDLDSFLARLSRMSAEERVLASRYEFTSRERTIWAGRFPDEVPMIHGEFEWIAARSPELE